MDDDGTAFGRFHQEGSGDMYVDPVDIRLEEGIDQNGNKEAVTFICRLKNSFAFSEPNSRIPRAAR